jgi:hypothetical protein
MNKYELTKQELVNATKRHLIKNGAFLADNDKELAFTPISGGTPRLERILEVYLTDDTPSDRQVVVVTEYRLPSGVWESEHTAFNEFSNDEMETIMRLTGIPVPENEWGASTITEIRSDYYCNSEGCTYIDVWENDEEEGKSVAHVYSSPLRVECVKGQEMLFADPLVQEEILEVVKNELGLPSLRQYTK